MARTKDLVTATWGARKVCARLTGRDDKGNEWTGTGYQEAAIRRGGKDLLGRLSWLAGGWVFRPYPEEKADG